MTALSSSSSSQWERLFKAARALIRQVNSEQSIIDHWTLGGGTAMMLQIGHRESHDIDIFLSDPQLLPFLDPRKRDFEFETQPNDCTGDGTKSLKLVFANVGEIDFIVAGSLTREPTVQTEIDGETALLEAIPEIVTKKVHYRSYSLKPRDIFDIAASGKCYANEIIAALRNYPASVTQALATMEKLNPDFVSRAIAQLAVKEPYRSITNTALERSKDILRSV